MWDLPQPGLEPVSPALAGGFLTTEPPGKPSLLDLILYPPRPKIWADPEKGRDKLEREEI